MAEEPAKPNWRGRIVIGVIVLLGAIRLFESYVGTPRGF